MTFSSSTLDAVARWRPRSRRHTSDVLLENMGAIISLGDRWIKISNGACSKAFDDAITVAEHHAATDTEKEYVSRLKYERQGFYAGYCPDFEGLFPTLEERKFWARCFFDSGRWLHEGQLENPPGGGSSPAMWIFNTYWMADLLRELIRRDDRHWVPDDRDTVLRAEQRERDLEAYRIKHEAVKAKRLAEQAGAGQPATRSESDSEGSDKPQHEAEGRSR